MNKLLALKTEVFSKIVKFSVSIFFLLLPLYFLPFTFDVVELNKSLFIILFALVLLAIYVYKIVLSKKFIFNLNYLTLPLLLLFAGFFLSFVFSLSVSFSLWGFYGSLSNSFPVLSSLVLITLLLATVVISRKTISLSIFFIVLGFTLVYFITLLSYFGVFTFTQNTLFGFLNNKFFTLVGPIGVLRVTTLVSTFLATYVLLVTKKVSKLTVSVFAITFSLVISAIYLGVFYTLLNIFFIALAYYFFGTSEKKKIGYIVAPVLIALSVLAASLSPDLAKNLKLDQGRLPFDSINNSTSWSVTNEVLGNRPLFGSGISTFIATYSSAKPVSVNSTDFWDTRFIKPSSFYLLVLSEMGLVTFLALLFLIIRFVINSTNILYKTKDSAFNELRALKFTVLIILLSLVANPGSALVLGLLFSLLGLVLASEKVNKSEKSQDRNIGISTYSNSGDTSISSLAIGNNQNINVYPVVISLAVLIFSAYIYFSYVILASDMVFKGVFNPVTNLLQLRDNYISAISIHPRNDFYRRSLIDVNKEIARALIIVPEDQAQNITDEERQNRINDITTLLRQSATQAEIITSATDLGINPINWEARGLLWQFVIGADNQAPVNAIQSYLLASQREPNNPRIVATIGTVYYQTEDYAQAAAYFERAVLLKPDYAAARYNLAKALEKLERYADAYAISQTVLNYLNKDGQDYKVASEYSDSLKVKAQEQISKSNESLNLSETDTNTEQPKLTEPDQPLQASPEQDTTNSTTQSVSPTITPSVTPTPVVSPTRGGTGNDLPGQNPAGEGEGFIEQNQGE